MAKQPSHSRRPAYSYHGKTDRRFRLPRFVPWLLVALAAVGLILWAVAVYLQQYMVYTRDGGTLVLPGEAVSDTTPVDNTPLSGLAVVEETLQSASAEDDALRAVEVSIDALLDGQAQTLLDEAGGNALILEMKPASGVLNWLTAQEADVSAQAEAVESALAQLLENGTYLIARICLLQDDALLARNNSLALTNSDGTLYADAEGDGWLNPESTILQDYLSNLAKELLNLGFSEILISNFGYPADWDGNLTEEERASSVDSLLSAISAAIAETGAEDMTGTASGNLHKLGAEVDSALLENGEISGTGLIFSLLRTYCDRIWCDGGVSDALVAAFSDTELASGALVLTGDSFLTDAPSSAQAILLS